MTVPTLNMASDNELLPKHGVYVSRIALDHGGFLNSVTNIGVRPTFGSEGVTVETFVLRDEVPESVQSGRLQFLHRIRDEKRFDSAGLLATQIARDAARASRFFRLLGNMDHARAHSH
jgi:riboflavin kinase/FMN adenylyltransferase